MAAIITLGELLVEVMAKRIGQPFDEPGEYVGPYPSGAPAIFIDQASKTGSSCRMIGMVGDDQFGRLIKHRLETDGVDVSYIGTTKYKTTGIAFVTYRPDGDRDFIFTTKDSAAAALTNDRITEEMFEGGRYLHVMGCSVFDDEMIAVFEKALDIAKSKGMQISFDPNIRKEIMKHDLIWEFIRKIARQCDVFLAGEDELGWITGIDDEREAVKAMLSQQARLVVVKKGRHGCRLYEQTANDTEVTDVAAFAVEEVDPTGAGDCFAGTFISLLNQGRCAKEAITYAAASGAVAVTRRGPMEGTATMEQLESFMHTVQNVGPSE